MGSRTTTKSKARAKRKLTLVGGGNPQMQKPRKNAWSKAKAKEFLGVLADTCNVSEACRQTGISVSGAYLRRGGDLALSWVRRSRLGWVWADDMDTPLGEARELYRVTVTAGAASISAECEAPEQTFPAAEVAVLGSGPAAIEVRQIGDRAVSRPATLSITFN